MKYIIFPDIHGRDFWKPVVSAYSQMYNRQDDSITYIFLGDYLDPYPQENISYNDAMSNFKEILKFQIESESQVILLLGNHDLHYISPNMARSSRFDFEHCKEIKEVFDNAMKKDNVLQMTYNCEVNGKTFYFSHAGVQYGWIKNNLNNLYQDWELKLNLDPRKDALKGLPSFNYLIGSPLTFDKFISALGDVPVERGGESTYGSMVWADWGEYLNISDEEKIPGIIQVFGHSQQEYDPINIDNEYYCLDVRRPFILNENGEITEEDGSSINIVNKEELLENKRKALEKLMMLFL